MFRLSCFHTSTLSAKQRKTVQPSSETQVPNSHTFPLVSDISDTMAEEGFVENFADHATDSIAVEFDEETESKNSIDRDILVSSGEGIKKSCSMGSFLVNHGSFCTGGDGQDLEISGHAENSDKSSGNTPRTPASIVKSVSLPYICSHRYSSRLPLRQSRSAEDLLALDSRQKVTLNPNVKTNFLQNDEGRNLDCNEHGGDNIDKPVDSSQLNDLSNKDFTKKRIEEWMFDLEQCSDFEASPEIIEVEKHGNNNLDISYAKKEEGKVSSPGMEVARKYISSLSVSATSAQLINLGLVTIPFLSPFSSVRALNLSGNAIVRITAGALPRGLHVLNLSKNNIATIEGLRDLIRLRVLDLSYNRILRIGHGLASCSSLKELYLAGNKISEVEGLHRLLKLNVVDLRFNKISTTKCLGQLASNYLSLQVISLEGNPAQKNVGDEQLKKYLQGLLPNLAYFNKQPIKAGNLKDTVERSARLGIGAHQSDRSLKVDVKNMRKGGNLSGLGRRSQPIVSSTKPSSSSRRLRLGATGGKVVNTTEQNDLHEVTDKLLRKKSDLSVRKSRSVGNLSEL